MRARGDRIPGGADVVTLQPPINPEAREGKLVDQDPNDEPASELLARIRAERTSGVAAGRSRSKRAAPP